jgi:hypothetical protein
MTKEKKINHRDTEAQRMRKRGVPLGLGLPLCLCVSVVRLLHDAGGTPAVPA